MRLPFLDRERETARLRACLRRREPTFSVLYGRRRCGKSRLLREVMARRSVAYYVGDERDARLQMQSVAQAMAAVVPGFDQVVYHDWDPLLVRWWRDAPAGAILAFDEFPWMVAASPALPGIIQKRLESEPRKAIHTVICGSSQRMMQGFVLDRNAPLYGRASEIVDVRPLGLHWLARAFKIKNARAVVDAYATWGGVPRYWELALDHPGQIAAVRALALDPMGVLHQEPDRLLYDDMREVSQAATVLALIGQGCRKISEIAARIGKPATTLARPIGRLVELGFVRREIPFGHGGRDTKRSFYAIDDPFLSFWFRYVEPNRSRLEAGLIEVVERDIRDSWGSFVGGVWESLARDAVPRLAIAGRTWEPAARWWGPGLDRIPVEIDIAARSTDGKAIMLGEAKLDASTADLDHISATLSGKARRLPFTQGLTIVPCAFVATPPPSARRKDMRLVQGSEVVEVLR